MKLEKYLRKFNQIADEWFEKATFLKENYDFFKNFFKKENLEKAEWEDLHTNQNLSITTRR
jgi:hypothetical protein